MRISLDFDDTFSSDIALWRQIVTLMKESGYDVRIVTARGEENEVYTLPNGNRVRVHPENNRDLKKAIEGLDIPVIYCGWKQKRNTCATEHQWLPDIWIDDMPDAIV